MLLGGRVKTRPLHLFDLEKLACKGVSLLTALSFLISSPISYAHPLTDTLAPESINQSIEEYEKRFNDLKEDLNSDNASVRVKAVLKLSELNDECARAPLTQLLNDDTKRIVSWERNLLRSALENLDGLERYERMLLQSDEPAEKEVAAYQLAKLAKQGHRRALNTLIVVFLDRVAGYKAGNAAGRALLNAFNNDQLDDLDMDFNLHADGGNTIAGLEQRLSWIKGLVDAKDDNKRKKAEKQLKETLDQEFDNDIHMNLVIGLLVRINSEKAREIIQGIESILQKKIKEGTIPGEAARYESFLALFKKVGETADKGEEKTPPIQTDIQVVTGLQTGADKQFQAETDEDLLKSFSENRKLPDHIEIIDISNLGPLCRVGSVAVFKNNIHIRDEDTRYRLEDASSANDPRDMVNVILRRYGQAVIAGSTNLPKLVIIDGGHVPLKRLMDEHPHVFEELKKAGMTFVCMAKKSMKYAHERFYTEGGIQAAGAGEHPKSIKPDQRSDLLRRFKQLRDAAHDNGKFYTSILIDIMQGLGTDDRRKITGPLDADVMKLLKLCKDKGDDVVIGYFAREDAAENLDEAVKQIEEIMTPKEVGSLDSFKKYLDYLCKECAGYGVKIDPSAVSDAAGALPAAELRLISFIMDKAESASQKRIINQLSMLLQKPAVILFAGKVGDKDTEVFWDAVLYLADKCSGDELAGFLETIAAADADPSKVLEMLVLTKSLAILSGKVQLPPKPQDVSASIGYIINKCVKLFTEIQVDISGLDETQLKKFIREAAEYTRRGKDYELARLYVREGKPPKRVATRAPVYDSGTRHDLSSAGARLDAEKRVRAVIDDLYPIFRGASPTFAKLLSSDVDTMHLLNNKEVRGLITDEKKRVKDAMQKAGTSEPRDFSHIIDAINRHFGNVRLTDEGEQTLILCLKKHFTSKAAREDKDGVLRALKAGTQASVSDQLRNMYKDISSWLTAPSAISQQTISRPLTVRTAIPTDCITISKESTDFIPEVKQRIIAELDSPQTEEQQKNNIIRYIAPAFLTQKDPDTIFNAILSLAVETDNELLNAIYDEFKVAQKYYGDGGAKEFVQSILKEEPEMWRLFPLLCIAPIEFVWIIKRMYPIAEGLDEKALGAELVAEMEKEKIEFKPPSDITKAENSLKELFNCTFIGRMDEESLKILQIRIERYLLNIFSPKTPDKSNEAALLKRVREMLNKCAAQRKGVLPNLCAMFEKVYARYEEAINKHFDWSNEDPEQAFKLYQKRAILDLCDMDRALLADLFGLGKTREAIGYAMESALKRRKEKPDEPYPTTLIVTKPTTTKQWKQEIVDITKGIDETKDILLIDGTKKLEKLRNAKPGMYKFIIVSDTWLAGEGRWAIEHLNDIVQPYVAIVDEAHRMSNEKTDRTKELVNLKAERRLLVTATPQKGDETGRLSPMLQWLMPGFKGEKDPWKMYGILWPLMVRRLKIELPDSFPKQIQIPLQVSLSDFHAGDLHIDVLRALLQEKNNTNALIVAELTMRGLNVEELSHVPAEELEDKLVSVFNQVLGMRDFIEKAGDKTLESALSDDKNSKELMARYRDSDNPLTPPEMSRLNRAFLKALYPKGMQDWMTPYKYIEKYLLDNDVTFFKLHNELNKAAIHPSLISPALRIELEEKIAGSGEDLFPLPFIIEEDENQRLSEDEYKRLARVIFRKWQKFGRVVVSVPDMKVRENLQKQLDALFAGEHKQNAIVHSEEQLAESEPDRVLLTERLTGKGDLMLLDASPKIQKLLEVVEEKDKLNEKVVIYSVSRPAINAVSVLLEQKGYGTCLLEKSTDADRKVKEFRVF